MKYLAGHSLRNFLSFSLVVGLSPILAGITGCGEKQKSTSRIGAVTPTNTRKPGFGCVQGVVMNGFTGQRFDLSTIKEPDGIYVLIRGNKLKAEYHKEDPNLVGEYYICDIPVENEYPIFANIAGFLPFESKVKIESSRPLRTPENPGNVSEEVPIIDPVLMGNFRLYPKANGNQKLVINVRNKDLPLPGALVDLQPLDPATGRFAFDGSFLNTLATRLVPTRKTTNSSGVAEFAASEIVYGGKYKLNVTPPASSIASIPGTIELALGLNGATPNDRNNWEYNIDLNETNQPLAVVACSKTSKNYNSDGTIKMTLNRPVRLSKGDGHKDGWTASLAGSTATTNPPKLIDDQPTNNASEHFDVTFEDDKILTLSLKAGAFQVLKKIPDYSLRKDNALNTDVDLRVIYNISTVMLDVTDSDSAGFNSKALSTVPGASACTDIRFFQEY